MIDESPSTAGIENIEKQLLHFKELILLKFITLHVRAEDVCAAQRLCGSPSVPSYRRVICNK